MSLIRNGYPVPTSRGFPGVLFSALLALALFYPGAATAQEVKQIKLTEKHIQSFIAAFTDMAKIYNGLNSDNPDPKVEAQVEAVAKKNGFASLTELEDVSMNITMIMSGTDPQTKKFTELPEQIKKEIAALKTDKTVPEAEKKENLVELQAALKTAKPIQFKENIALVLKYFDRLPPLMQEQVATCGLGRRGSLAYALPYRRFVGVLRRDARLGGREIPRLAAAVRRSGPHREARSRRR